MRSPKQIFRHRCHFAPIFPYRDGGDYAREKKGREIMMNTRRNADAIRQLMKSPVWADDGAVKLYLYCLAMASHNQYCWRGLQLQPGDMPLSERKTAKALCWSRDKLRHRMRMLEAQGMVTIQSIPNVGTMLHVVNWPVADTAVLKNGPVWLHDGAITEVWDVQDCTGYPWAAQQAWYQDDTSYQATGIAVRPTDAQDQTSSAQTGTLVRPNPYKKNIYTSSLGYGMKTEPDRFSEIWFAYPQNRRINREAAAELVEKALNDGATVDSILAALEAEKQTVDWSTANGQYVPGIVKWLEREPWRSYADANVAPQVPDNEEQWESW